MRMHSQDYKSKVRCKILLVTFPLATTQTALQLFKSANRSPHLLNYFLL